MVKAQQNPQDEVLEGQRLVERWRTIGDKASEWLAEHISDCEQALEKETDHELLARCTAYLEAIALMTTTTSFIAQMQLEYLIDIKKALTDVIQAIVQTGPGDEYYLPIKAAILTTSRYVQAIGNKLGAYPE